MVFVGLNTQHRKMINLEECKISMIVVNKALNDNIDLTSVDLHVYLYQGPIH